MVLRKLLQVVWVLVALAAPLPAATQGLTAPPRVDNPVLDQMAADVNAVGLQDGLPASDELTQMTALDAPVGEEIGRGGASWYGIQFHKRRTASGERFDMGALTAAHRTLPFGTLVCVRSMVNGRQVLVRINDRGPFAKNRIIDLSRAAADVLGMLGLGIKQVVLTLPTSKPAACAQ